MCTGVFVQMANLRSKIGYKQESPPSEGLPFSSSLTTARRHLSADASMLCDGLLTSAGQYAGICSIMCAWHVSRQGGSIKQIVPLYSMECQQVEHMPVHIVRDNAMPAN